VRNEAKNHCATLASGAYWLAAVMAAGFAARVASGPRFSPLALLATRVIAPRLGPPELVPGPPKQFAQAMGLVMTTAVALIAIVAADHVLADVLLGAMIISAGLEAGFGLCLGCRIFALAMRAGLVPESVCLECADVRLPRAAGA